MAVTFIVHQTTLGSNEQNYLDEEQSSSSTITNGFQPNSPAYAAAVNAVLHETSLVVTALAQNMNTINPTSDIASVKTALTNYLVSIKPTNAVTADVVANKLSYYINGTSDDYDGSSPKSIGTIYAPVTSASPTSGYSGQLLLSNLSRAPVWTSGNIGSDKDKPIYLDDKGRLQVCAKYSGATAVVLNGIDKHSDDITIYAPVTNTADDDHLLVSRSDGTPIWTTGAYSSSAQKPLYLSSSGKLMVCDIYAGGTRLNVNGTTHTTSATIYAPTSNAVASDYVAVSNANSPYAPRWVDNSFYLRATFDNGLVFRSQKILMRQKISADFSLGNVIKDASDDYSTTYPFIFNYKTGTYYSSSDNAFEVGYSVSDQIYDETNAPSTYFEKAVKYTWSRYLCSSGGGNMMTLTLTGRTKTNAGVGKLWVDAGGIETSGPITSSNAITGSSYLATSDIRKKDNIKDYEAKRSILDLQVKQFDLKSDGSHHIGCIAQELQEICPEIVHEDSDGYLSIEETKLVYLLLNEVKKIRNELNELKGNK